MIGDRLDLTARQQIVTMRLMSKRDKIVKIALWVIVIVFGFWTYTRNARFWPAWIFLCANCLLYYVMFYRKNG